MNKKEIDQIFDIPLDENIDKYDSPNSTFEDKCEDVKSVMDHDDNKIISSIVSEVSKSSSKQKENKPVVSSAANSDDDIFEDEVNNVEKNNIISENTESVTETKEELTKNEDTCKFILSKYSQFKLKSPSKSFNDFYNYKIEMLGEVLSRFPVLDVISLNEELSQINTANLVCNNDADPIVIFEKLGEAYNWRARLGSLIIESMEQMHVWEQCCSTLKAYLFTTHESRGQNKRDSLSLEHMRDLDMYISHMRGFIDAAKHIDTILKSASDTLSRQLSCLQIKDSLGFKKLDHLDNIQQGAVISGKNKHNYVKFAVEDEISQLG